jgi:signal transduction histidine kinase
VGVSSDITNRKTADLERDKLLSDLANQSSALSRLTATLEQRVRERTRDLTREIAAREKAQEQLLQSQKMESIGQLTGGVAHDFNNLLMAIMGNLDLLKKRLSSDTRAMRLIDGAMRGAHRGASLTKRMLAFARQQDLNTTATDLGELINGMRDLLDRSLGPYITLTINVRPNLSPAEVDANQVELAILNLTINARDAMVDRGAITITIDRDPDENGDGFLAVSIADTGSGMSEETLKRAIEPFFSTKPVGKGTGLGLSMVHGLAVQLGGSLKLKSAIGQGTTATLRLPVAKRYAIQEETSVAEIIKDRVAKILVVDDDALIAMSTVDMLEDLGHKVLEANSGKHALELLESDGPIDLMMTDYAMPGMTGAELAEIVHRTYPHMPILLATGYADLPSGQKSDLPRISKPYLQEQLRVEIGRLLGQ